MFEGFSQVQKKKMVLFIVLCAFILTNALIAEFTGVKIFSFGKLLGLESFVLPGLFQLEVDFNLSVGVLMWPLVFVFSDIMNEYFGKQGVRFVSILTAIMIAFGFMVVYAGTKLPAADFWLNLNQVDSHGLPFDIDYAYSVIFRQGVGIMIGSITAFLVSQLIDVTVFKYLKGKTGAKKLWLRATGSTIVSQLIDTFVILTIAFYLFGNWSFTQVMSVAIVQYSYKVLIAIEITPLIYLVHYIIDRYLGKDLAHEMLNNSKTSLN
jgi:uncharacterized integral membrane protein (TIGR00697 family)